jgi:thiol-disulfide isomerase/thioredoxin
MFRRLDIHDVRKLAEDKGGKLISTKYKNAHQSLVWQCSSGHIFKSNQSNIQSGNNWCGECTKIERLNTIKKIAKINNLECLSKAYLGTNKKLKWKCKNGHILFRSPEHIRQKRGCYECYGNKPLGLDYVNKVAEKKGGKCISKKYTSVREYLKWKCSKGHIWKAKYNTVAKNDVWCPKCHDQDQLDALKLIAKNNSGKFLSPKFIGWNSKYEWKCKEGHIWKADGSAVKLGTWCGVCAGTAPISIQEIQKLAKAKGGKCLSKKNLGAHKKLKWQCKEGHIWKASAANVIHNKSWCPKCHFYFSEEICRTTFEQIFKTKFPKSRPKWLIGLKGYLMELDGYSKKLGIAFEYHGEQHFGENFYVKNKDTLDYGVKRDKEKLKLCKRNNVKLIVLTYKDDLSRLPEIIKNKTKLLKISTNINFKKTINFDKIYSHKTKIEELDNIARKKGGECLSKKYFGALKKIKWKCSNGHIWSTTPDKIRRGRWCPRCSRTAPLTLEDMQKIANERNGKCLSKKYMGNRTPLIWQCAKGHIWRARPYSVKSNGSWCRKCYNQNYKRRATTVRSEAI